VKTFPVVHETAGRLIETGINTLQKTLLLKKEVEVTLAFSLLILTCLENKKHYLLYLKN